MFDKTIIKVKAGDGGRGAISFRREKFVPFGGPDGGNGGSGGSVVVRATGSVDSLMNYRLNKIYRAENGRNGGGSKKHGKNGRDLDLKVPLGTVVKYRSENDDEFVADLAGEGDEVVVSRGGRGGWGNTHFASSTNQSPQIAQVGERGEEQTISLEMRLIADVGIIGYPNVGKSTLLAAASAAKPKIDSYPFTTTDPVMGVVEVGQDRFVMAEIPGLIEGAHLGRGLGHEFLKHTMRTKILIHLISGISGSPVEDMIRVNEELAFYDTALARKPQIVAINKIDLPEVQDKLETIKDEFSSLGTKSYYISAATGQGIPELMTEAARVLKSVAAGKKEEGLTRRVFRPKPRDAVITVSKVGDVFVLSVPELERIVTRAGAGPSELRWQFKDQLIKLGVNRVLEKAGVKPGSKIRCGELEWEW
jgi:GTP-binding protein